MLITILACDPAEDSAPKDEATSDFLWGTATAGFQVEPGCPTLSPCEDPNSDWYQWVTDPELIAESGTHLSGEPLSAGPGHYELWEDDLDLALALGTNAIRVSIEWSRLFPDGAAEAATSVDELEAHADPAAVAWYDAYFDGIVARGLTPVVTLNHYTLPLWVHDGKSCHLDLAGCSPNGWMDAARMSRLLELYGGFAARHYGDRVRWWATLNEPLAIVLAGYLLPSSDRTNPPGVVDPEAAFAVTFALVEGHAALYDGVHAEDEDAMVGLVPNLAAVQPADPEDPLDVQGAEHGDYVYNRVMLNAAILGEFDRDVDGVAEESRPDIAGKMDWIGVNYYTRITFIGLDSPLFEGYAMTDFFPSVLWEDYPEGIGEVVSLAASYGPPVMITENGTQPTDESGESFLRPHLASLFAAKDAGVDVRGYFYWSLMDNYEWNHGMSMKFGLYEVDVDSKARSLRPIGETYAAIIADGRP